jgi:hypothetical protein
MSIGTILEVGIGLIFVFLLLGLIVSALQEVVAALLALRSKYLMEGLSTILAEKAGVCWIARRHYFNSKLNEGSDLFKKVADHALVNGITPSKIPSYVAAGNFASALIDVLQRGGTGTVASNVQSAIAALPPGAPVREALTTLLTDAAGDMGAFRKKVETWFDEAMERVSGRYKRWTQYFAIIAGIVLAVGLNANTVLIADALWRDPVLRANAVKAAESYLEDCEANPETCPPSQKKADETTTLPAEDSATSPPTSTEPSTNATDPAPPTQPDTGEATSTPTPAPDTSAGAENTPSPTETVEDQAGSDADDQPADLEEAKETIANLEDTIEKLETRVQDATSLLTEIGYPIGWTMEKPVGEGEFFDWLVAIIGWLITGLAVSLGAPFWFDMLKTFVNVRGAGQKPPETKPSS